MHIDKDKSIFSFICVLLDAAEDETVCDGTEDIQTLQSPYTDTSQLRATNMVYKAVYAIAHAIHNAACEDANSTAHCDKFTRMESKQVDESDYMNIINVMLPL